MFGRLLRLACFGWLDGSWLLLSRGLLRSCLLRGCFLRFGREECGLGFGDKVEFTIVRDSTMPCECETDGKAGELVVACAFDKGKQDFFCAALLVLVRHIFGEIIGKRVGVKVDQGAKNDAQL